MPTGSSPEEALANTIRLARACERLGYSRYCHDPAARLRSYELLAEAFELEPRAVVRDAAA